MTYESMYSGFDRDKTRDATGWVVEDARRRLPQPEVNHYCRRHGHKWGEPWSPIHPSAEVRGCIRCAKRGLIVLETSYVR